MSRYAASLHTGFFIKATSHKNKALSSQINNLLSAFMCSHLGG